MKLALRFQKAVAVAMEGNSAFKKARRKKKKQNWRPPFKNVIPKVTKNESLVPIFVLRSSVVIFVMPTVSGCW